jgi:hypothetical protein
VRLKKTEGDIQSSKDLFQTEEIHPR